MPLTRCRTPEKASDTSRVYPNAENNQLVKMNIRTDLQEVIYKAMKVSDVSKTSDTWIFIL